MNPTHCSDQIVEAEDVFQSAMHTFSDTQELFKLGTGLFTIPVAINEDDPPLSLLCQSRGRMWQPSSVKFPVIGWEPILIMLAASVYVWIEKMRKLIVF